MILIIAFNEAFHNNVQEILEIEKSAYLQRRPQIRENNMSANERLLVINKSIPDE